MKEFPALIERLKNLEIFGKLRNDVREDSNAPLPADLLDIFEQFLFIWDFKEQAIHAINLNYESSARSGPEYQTLLLTSRPLGPVCQLLVSPAGQRLALVGSGGVTVVELPARWGKHGLFEGGKPLLTCKSHQVAERFFLCTKHVRVTKVRWHPESPGDCHLVVLCSDNYLRVYDVSADLQTPSQALALGATHSASLGGRLGASFVRSLGEVAVSFVFGNRPPPPPPPADVQVQHQEEYEPLPVYILRGNGDIYITCINLMATRERFQVLGPVSMHPAADDNYGTDACDLLCVGGSPAVLVVATPSRLYHCIVLDRPADEVEDGAGSEVSSSRYSSCFSLEPAAVSLYVYESVELDMVLAPAEDDHPMTSPIRLHRDPASDCRYFCSHAAGVHAVAMPLIAAVERFAAQPDGSDEPLGEHECIVEHLVSTRPVSSSPACPVVGLTVLPHPLLMVVLLATREVLLLPLVAKFRPPPPPPVSEDETTSAALGAGQDGESFAAHISRLLERADSLPVLRSAGEPSAADERLNLVSRAAHRLRTEYVQRQQLARAALQQQTAALHKLQRQQAADAQQLGDQLQQLQQRAEGISGTWRELEESHRRLLDRAEAVFRRCQQGVPVLSDAEKAVSRELKTLGDVTELQSRLDALQDKFDYQKKQVSLQKANEQRQDRQLSALSAAQRSMLRTELAAQGDQIAGLVQTVQAARRTLGV